MFAQWIAPVLAWLGIELVPCLLLVIILIIVFKN